MTDLELRLRAEERVVLKVGVAYLKTPFSGKGCYVVDYITTEGPATCVAGVLSSASECRRHPQGQEGRGRLRARTPRMD